MVLPGFSQQLISGKNESVLAGFALPPAMEECSRFIQGYAPRRFRHTGDYQANR